MPEMKAVKRVVALLSHFDLVPTQIIGTKTATENPEVFNYGQTWQSIEAYEVRDTGRSYWRRRRVDFIASGGEESCDARNLFDEKRPSHNERLDPDFTADAAH
jgi:hypothetical protein